jgi:sulfide:quinone oxidoreductase
MSANGTHHNVVIVGGGSAGITVAAQLCNQLDSPDIAIIEPSEVHYYQPLWTLVGAGVFPREETMRSEADLIPYGATWIKDAVANLDPDNNQLTTRDGKIISYDWLVMAAGIKIDWEAIKGLKENIGTHGICSNYSFETVNYTWETLKNFKGGTAIFTQPSTGVKCAGAPQKICYLADDAMRRSGVRHNSNIIFASGTGSIFGVAKYAATLNKVIDRKGIDARFQHELEEIRVSPSKEAVFKKLDTGEEVVVPFEMMHVTPRQTAPDFIKNSPLAAEVGGWVDVDQHTLQHNRYPNVFALGDNSSLATSKTGAAIRKQSPVCSNNLMAAMRGEALPDRYNGYTSCPLITGYGSLVLAEFDYDKVPQESFPFDQSQERYSMYMMKKYALPRFYWHGMLRGRM